ncbi:hypothetical protein [Paenibacillus ginsengihumi]|uniref:hypothetical protein n=1 Tax=Paenibacillus ginsengihumi TaxID=431596 RepID=UPI0003636E85|nr:hypothetical protein [Paenibacillus ginsengihumi]
MSLQPLVAYLVERKGVIPGKKAFQKYMYFLDAKGVPTPLSFRIHHFGPYSSELDYETDNLQIEGVLEVSPNAHGNGFTIKSGNRTKSIIEHHSEWIREHEAKINFVLNALPSESKSLELWSTTHFVANSMNKFYGGAVKVDVVRGVRSIKKDKFTATEIEAAYDRLIELKLLP